MKKFWLPVLLAGVFSISVATANNDKCPKCNNKKMSDKKAVRKSKKGLKHGYYDVTHNKATRATKINHGNQKYKYQDDVR
jgi:predicted nucleic-acid-binding Zn-ribbon protein